MAALIKNQILKHLSKFTKNLQPEKINLSTLKGEGELSNLELDENVLTEILELPTWLKLTKAVCNRVAIKIQWTKLKSQPICLYLDEIEVDMEAGNATERKSNSASPLSNLSTSGKYGFAERIIDGMYLSINSVSVNFKAKAFGASIQLSRIIIQSRTPTWGKGELKYTRIKDEMRGEIIIFKEAEWQTLRIEANALAGEDPSIPTTPLRLIANQSKIRITIKKRLSDCGMVASRLQVNLDDLLWVLTDSQLKAALTFMNSLKEVIKESLKQSKMEAAERLKKQGILQSPARNKPLPNHTQQHQKQGNKSQQAIAALFKKYDVVETSYHVYTGRIDLHLCDDLTDSGGDRRKVEGGALQVVLLKLCIDHYPYHPAGGDRKHWIKYDENMTTRDSWATELLNVFKDDVRKVRDSFVSNPANLDVPNDTSAPVDPSGKIQPNKTGKPAEPLKGKGESHMPGYIKDQITKQTKLLESSIVIRLEDYTIYQVSTAGDPKRSQPKKFLSSEKKQLLLPPEMSSAHIEYTDYYFPEGIDFPVPPSNLFVVVNPVRLTLDYLTILWMNAFLLNLAQRVDIPQDEGPKIHVDTKIDALMPRIVLPAEKETVGQSDRPDGLMLQMSRVTMSNSRLEARFSRQELEPLATMYSQAKLFQRTNIDFPNTPQDLLVLSDNFLKHSQNLDSPYFDKGIEEILQSSSNAQNHTASPAHSSSSQSRMLKQSSISSTGLTYFNMRNDSFQRDANCDIWCINIDQFWCEFVGVPCSKHRPLPFVESFPLTLWMCKLPTESSPSEPFHSPSLSLSNSNSMDSENNFGANLGSPSVNKPNQTTFEYVNNIDTLKCGTQCKSGTVIVEQNQSEHTQDVNNENLVCNRQYGETNMIVKLGAKVNVQINHYQYLFLMRLIDSVTRVQKELEEDIVFITKKPIPESRTAIACMLEEVEVAFICPPIPEIPSSHPSREVSADDIEEAVAVQEKEQNVECNIECNDKEIEDDIKNQNISKEHETVQFEYQQNTTAYPEVSVSFPEEATVIDSATSNYTNHIMDDVNYSSGNDSMQNSMHSNLIEDNRRMSSHSQLDDNRSRSSSQNFIDDNRSRSSSQNLMEDHRNSTQSSLQKKTGKTGNDIKKSFSSAMTSFSKFTDKVKNKLDIDDMHDDWETISTMSGSSEDDYILLKFQNESEMPAFERRYDNDSDDASLLDSVSEMHENDMSSVYSTASEKSRGVVSVLSFKLRRLEAAVKINGKDMTVSATLDEVEPVEHGNINLDKFQQKFASVCREDEPPHPDRNPPIKVRFQAGPAAEELVPTAGEKGLLKAQANGLELSLRTSSLTNIGELFEDEVIPEVVPMQIEASNIKITLKDDKPPTHLTSPGSVPIDLVVGMVNIVRGPDGIFHIDGATPKQQIHPSVSEHENLKLQVQHLQRDIREISPHISPTNQNIPHSKSNQDLARENEMLRKQIEKIGKLSLGDSPFHSPYTSSEALHLKPESHNECHKKQSHLQEEQKKLLLELTRKNDEVDTLQQERESLLSMIKMLQEELYQSEEIRVKNHQPRP